VIRKRTTSDNLQSEVAGWMQMVYKPGSVGLLS
jgi:hypothetical protein